MHTLASPIVRNSNIIGFTVRSYTDVPGGYIAAALLLHCSDGSTEEKVVTLWSGSDNLSEERTVPAEEGSEPTVIPAVPNPSNFKYSDAGQWTDESAAARIEQILAE